MPITNRTVRSEHITPNPLRAGKAAFATRSAQDGRNKPGMTGRVLRIQMLICVLLLAAVLTCRYTAPALYASLQIRYAELFESSDNVPQLVRFAQSVLNATALPAYADSAAPESCSLKAYTPQTEYTAPLGWLNISSGYGWRVHPLTKKKLFHTGTDLACDEGSHVFAVMDGSVEAAAHSGTYGNYIRLRHADGVETLYAHMQYLFVRTGEQVRCGQRIGTSGHTGNATGPHLHFEVLVDDVCHDPKAFFATAGESGT